MAMAPHEPAYKQRRLEFLKENQQKEYGEEIAKWGIRTKAKSQEVVNVIVKAANLTPEIFNGTAKAIMQTPQG